MLKVIKKKKLGFKGLAPWHVCYTALSDVLLHLCDGLLGQMPGIILYV